MLKRTGVIAVMETCLGSLLIILASFFGRKVFLEIPLQNQNGVTDFNQEK